MKNAEDEAFDEIARKQGHWGGGFMAKRAMAADKINSDFDEEYKKSHAELAKYRTEAQPAQERASPCARHCEAQAFKIEIRALKAQLAQPAQNVDYWIREATAARQAEMALRRELESLAQPAQEPVDIASIIACREMLDAQPVPEREPDALTIAYQSGYYDGKRAARARCIELVLAGSSMPVQTRTLEALQRDRKRIAKLIEEDGK